MPVAPTRTSFTRRFGSLAALLGVAMFALPRLSSAQSARADSAAVTEIVNQFHAALASGDSARAVSLLAEDLIVLEAGASETYAEYLGHHLAADMKASKASTGERAVTRVTVIGNAAFLVARTLTPGTTANPQGSESAEMMVLSKTATGWRIRAIHWSSRRRRA